MKEGGEYGEIFFESRRMMRITHEENRIQQVISGSDRGIGIRLIKNHKTSYAWTNVLKEKALLEIASGIAKISGGGHSSQRELGPSRVVTIPWKVEYNPEDVEFQGKIELVERAREGVSSSDLIHHVKVNYSDITRKIQIANTEGDFLAITQPHVLIAVQVVAARDGELQIGYEAEGASRGLELFEEAPPEDVGKKAGERAVMMLVARKAPGGKMPVVLSQEAGGTMVHEAVGHGLEADLASGGLSVYAGKMGEQIASHLVTVVDDPTVPGKRGSFPIDDEGTETRRNILVERGILKGFMYDRLQSMKGGAERTGNGRRESYRHRPIPRMSNTLIAPGDSDPAEVIHSTDKGLLVRKMGGGQVNTVTGDFMFEVSEGYFIEKGKVGDPVRGATLTGNGPEVLKMIDMVGNDLGYGLGTCGKDGQGVPVADAQPTLRIGHPYITVGGATNS